MSGSASGVLVGGTLTQLMASMGTPWAFEPSDGCILFLEDIGERPYRIHRLLTQAAQARVFTNARAIVFGEFPGCDEPGGDPAIRDVLREFTSEFGGPVLFNFPSGHTNGATWKALAPNGVALVKDADVVLAETPTNPALDVVDLHRLAQIMARGGQKVRHRQHRPHHAGPNPRRPRDGGVAGSALCRRAGEWFSWERLSAIRVVRPFTSAMRWPILGRACENMTPAGQAPQGAPINTWNRGPPWT